ncbi:MAG: hypothetical protein HOI35_11740 [Woeseia sp.]|nr:hypothetical protein [Woeseia sp.]
MRPRNQERGIGIVELMIAITIGMVLIAGALSVFVNSRATYNTNQEFSRLMENGNYALDEISRSLRLAGYWGRNNAGDLIRRRTGDTGFPEIYLSSAATNDCSAGWYANTTRRVEGLENTNSPYGSTCVLDARYQAGTDVLVFRHVEPTEVATASLVANTVYIRADPAGAEFFVGTTEPTGFTDTAANFLCRAEAYYISPFNLTVGDGLPSLKRAALVAGPELFVPTNPDASEVVIPGVENLQVKYGIDTTDDGSANQYLNADTVAATQWDDIVAVRVTVLVRSEFEEAHYSNTSSYRLPDGLYTPSPADGFRRMVVTRTVELRN